MMVLRLYRPTGGSLARGLRALGLVLAVAGCAGGGPGASTAPAGGSSTNPGGGGPTGSEEFGLSFDQLVAKAEAVEALIGQCMADAGFEYVPTDFATIRAAMTSDKSAPGLSDAEFVQQYGYGISTQFPKPIVSLALGEDNRRRREALSEADRVAYDRTLLGDDREATFAYALEMEDFSRTGGCTRKAVEQAFTPEEMTQAYLNPRDARILQDQRVIDAVAAFATCMQDAGFEYGHPDDVEQDLLDRLDAITEGEDPTTLTGSKLDALTELQAYERSVAPVAYQCEAQHLQSVVDQVDRELFG